MDGICDKICARSACRPPSRSGTRTLFEGDDGEGEGGAVDGALLAVSKPSTIAPWGKILEDAPPGQRAKCSNCWRYGLVGWPGVSQRK